MNGGESAGESRVWPVWGHQSAVATLQQAVARERIRHAYLFSGSEGVGKTTLATVFAQALLCQAPAITARPCGECLACRKVARGVHPDVESFNLERQARHSGQKGTKHTSLTIETVREVRSSVGLRPMEGRWRVILVADANLLQEIAQEALLKVLEEPPSYMVLILMSTEAELLLPTIRSRCELVELKPVSARAIAAGLMEHGVERQAALELASYARGAPGWALRAQRDPRLAEERGAAVGRGLDWMTATPYQRLVSAVKLGDSFSKRRGDVFAELETLLGLWRDAMLLRAGSRQAILFPSVADLLDDRAREWPLDGLARAVRSVLTCLADLDANVRPRLALEAMVLQWPTQRSPSRTG